MIQVDMGVWFCIGEHVKTKYHVPISQVVPSYPGAHIHVNALISSVHVAPFRQGFELHSLMSEIRKPVLVIKCLKCIHNNYKHLLLFIININS